MHWYIVWACRKGSKDATKLLNHWNQVKHILLVWPPTGIDLYAADVIIKRVMNRFPEARVSVVEFPGIGVSSLNTALSLFPISTVDINFWGLPTRTLIDRLSKMKTDIVVDLSMKYNPLSACICMLSLAPLKIGFAIEESEQVMNFQVAPKNERTDLEKYKILAKYIG